jgi:type IV pilus assembly protein PilC
LRRLPALTLVTKQLAALISANVDLCEGLDALSRNAPRRSLQRLYHALANDLTSGLTLSAAIRRRPRFFPGYYADLVRAGETSGTLGKVLSELSAHLGEQKSVNVTIKGWFTYIGVVFAGQAAIVAFVLVKVLPVFEELFSQFGNELPRRFLFLTAIRHVFFRFWWVGLDAVLSVLLVFFLMRYLLRQRGAFAASVGWVVSRIPILRILVVKWDLAQFSLVLEQLLAAGVPLDTALEDAAAIDVSPMYALAMHRLARRVFEGESLHAAMERESRWLFPASFRGFVSMGESNGLLPEALGKVGRFYLQEVVTCQRVLSDVLSPLALALPAAVVLLLNTSFFLAYTAMIQVLLNEM